MSNEQEVEEQAPEAEESTVEESAATETDEVTEMPETEEGDATDPAVRQVEEQLLRLRADFENFRKRTQREKEQWSAHAMENLMTDLLTVLDHFELGLKNAAEHEAKPAVAEGFQLVYDQMNQLLKKHKLEEIEAEGVAFDPTWHEAVSSLPSPDVESGHVAILARRGYTLGSRVLRPAQVVVSSGPPEDAEA